jgi:anaerobic magnesium-protoporphyrin IX monomethyl ester cyclase
MLIKNYNLNSICFRDELLMVSEKRTVEFAERMIKEDLGIKFDIDGRLRVAKRAPYVLKLLAKAGCVYVNYGVESLDQQVLNNMNKLQTVEEIYDGVKATREAGIHSGLNVMFGNVGDNKETAKKTVDFLKEFDTYGEMRTLKPVTPYPGSPLYELAKRNGLIEGCKDFYENKHLNSDRLAANFTELSDNEFYGVLLDCNKELIHDYYKAKEKENIQAHERLYLEGDTTFRGVRH